MREHVDKMRDIVLQTLRTIITNDYILLDLPYQRNVGDVLIWQAFEDIKPQLGHRCLYQCSEATYDKPSIDKDVILVFMGGGNFGDLWEHHQIFRYQVMNDFPDNPFVQLQQSVWFDDPEKMKQDVIEFQKHRGKVSICLRDKQSYDIIQENYPSVETYLLPDLALTFDVESYCTKHHININQGNGNLLALRRDKEAVDISKYKVPSDVEVSDWPSMMCTLPKQAKVQKWIRRCEKYLHSKALARLLTDYLYRKVLKYEYINSGIDFLNSYKTIYATRLHVAILAALMGKETYIIDNSYHKISGVYNQWMKNSKIVKML